MVLRLGDGLPEARRLPLLTGLRILPISGKSSSCAVSSKSIPCRSAKSLTRRGREVFHHRVALAININDKGSSDHLSVQLRMGLLW